LVNALAVTLDQLQTDHFIRAKINGLTFLYIQDTPEEWNDFSQIQAMPHPTFIIKPLSHTCS